MSRGSPRRKSRRQQSLIVAPIVEGQEHDLSEYMSGLLELSNKYKMAWNQAKQLEKEGRFEKAVTKYRKVTRICQDLISRARPNEDTTMCRWTRLRAQAREFIVQCRLSSLGSARVALEAILGTLRGFSSSAQPQAQAREATESGPVGAGHAKSDSIAPGKPSKPGHRKRPSLWQRITKKTLETEKVVKPDHWANPIQLQQLIDDVFTAAENSDLPAQNLKVAYRSGIGSLENFASLKGVRVRLIVRLARHYFNLVGPDWKRTSAKDVESALQAVSKYGCAAAMAPIQEAKGLIYANGGQWGKALVCFKEAVKLAEENQNVVALEDLQRALKRTAIAYMALGGNERKSYADLQTYKISDPEAGALLNVVQKFCANSKVENFIRYWDYITAQGFFTDPFILDHQKVVTYMKRKRAVETFLNENKPHTIKVEELSRMLQLPPQGASDIVLDLIKEKRVVNSGKIVLQKFYRKGFIDLSAETAKLIGVKDVKLGPAMVELHPLEVDALDAMLHYDPEEIPVLKALDTVGMEKLDLNTTGHLEKAYARLRGQRNGGIIRSQFADLLKEFGCGADEAREGSSRLMKAADLDKDGEISLEEFKKAFVRKRICEDRELAMKVYDEIINAETGALEVDQPSMKTLYHALGRRQNRKGRRSMHTMPPQASFVSFADFWRMCRQTSPEVDPDRDHETKVYAATILDAFQEDEILAAMAFEHKWNPLPELVLSGSLATKEVLSRRDVSRIFTLFRRMSGDNRNITEHSLAVYFARGTMPQNTIKSVNPTSEQLHRARKLLMHCSGGDDFVTLLQVQNAVVAKRLNDHPEFWRRIFCAMDDKRKGYLLISDFRKKGFLTADSLFQKEANIDPRQGISFRNFIELCLKEPEAQTATAPKENRDDSSDKTSEGGRSAAKLQLAAGAALAADSPGGELSMPALIPFKGKAPPTDGPKAPLRKRSVRADPVTSVKDRVKKMEKKEPTLAEEKESRVDVMIGDDGADNSDQDSVIDHEEDAQELQTEEPAAAAPPKPEPAKPQPKPPAQESRASRAPPRERLGATAPNTNARGRSPRRDGAERGPRTGRPPQQKRIAVDERKMDGPSSRDDSEPNTNRSPDGAPVVRESPRKRQPPTTSPHRRQKSRPTLWVQLSNESEEAKDDRRQQYSPRSAADFRNPNDQQADGRRVIQRSPRGDGVPRGPDGADISHGWQQIPVRGGSPRIFRSGESPKKRSNVSRIESPRSKITRSRISPMNASPRHFKFDETTVTHAHHSYANQIPPRSPKTPDELRLVTFVLGEV